MNQKIDAMKEESKRMWRRKEVGSNWSAAKKCKWL